LERVRGPNSRKMQRKKRKADKRRKKSSKLKYTGNFFKDYESVNVVR
jgi:hypothetical protein